MTMRLQTQTDDRGDLIIYPMLYYTVSMEQIKTSKHNKLVS